MFEALAEEEFPFALICQSVREPEYFTGKPGQTETSVKPPFCFSAGAAKNKNRFSPNIYLRGMQPIRETVYLSLGSNLGNREQQLADALRETSRRCGTLSRISPVYKTAAWGNKDQPDFLNLVAALETSLEPAILLGQLLETERAMGRVRGEAKWQPRYIDIDILFYGQRIVHEDQLIIPHPFLHERLFVLKPLCDIAPDLKHPLSGLTCAAMLQECADQLPVIRHLDSLGL